MKFGESTRQERDKLVEERVPKSTVIATDFWLKVFNSYNEKQEKQVDLKTSSKSDIADLLEALYADLWKKDDTTYDQSSYFAARSAIQRHVSAIRTDVNIFTCVEFKRCNTVLDAILKDHKRSGPEKLVAHKDHISDNDWKLLTDFFLDIENTDDPHKLTYYVWFHVTSKFCQRGAEIQRQMTKKDLVLKSVEGKDAWH